MLSQTDKRRYRILREEGVLAKDALAIVRFADLYEWDDQWEGESKFKQTFKMSIFEKDGFLVNIEMIPDDAYDHNRNYDTDMESWIGICARILNPVTEECIAEDSLWGIDYDSPSIPLWRRDSYVNMCAKDVLEEALHNANRILSLIAI